MTSKLDLNVLVREEGGKAATVGEVHSYLHEGGHVLGVPALPARLKRDVTFTPLLLLLLLLKHTQLRVGRIIDCIEADPKGLADKHLVTTS